MTAVQVWMDSLLLFQASSSQIETACFVTAQLNIVHKWNILILVKLKRVVPTLNMLAYPSPIISRHFVYKPHYV